MLIGRDLPAIHQGPKSRDSDMTEAAAQMIWLSVAAYLGLGCFVALLVLAFGLGRLDGAAASMPLRVRLIIAPGLAALWPLVLVRLAGIRPREDRP